MPSSDVFIPLPGHMARGSQISLLFTLYQLIYEKDRANG